MSKLGISIRIDVTKIDKSRLFVGKKGTYLDLSTLIDVETQDQYDNNGFIAQSVTKEERESGVQTAILGNCKIYYNSGAVASHKAGVESASKVLNEPAPGFDDDEAGECPF